MILYHGMVVDRRIDGWDLSKRKADNSNDQEGPGFYFCDLESVCRQYGGFIHTCNVDVKNFVDGIRPVKKADRRKLSDLLDAAPDLEDKLSNWDEDPIKAKMDFLEGISHRDLWDAATQIWYDFYRHEAPIWAENASKICRIDGYLVPPEKNNRVQHAVILNPKTIEILKVEKI